MIVCHGFERGWVDNLFVSLNEFWLRDLATGDIVFNDDIEKGDIGPRSFQAEELIFTGEWAKDALASLFFCPCLSSSRSTVRVFQAWRFLTVTHSLVARTVIVTRNQNPVSPINSQ